MVPSQSKAASSALAVLTLLLAGCVEGQEEASSVPTASLTVDDRIGAIQGLVSDDEHRIIPAADVGLRGRSLVTRTDADGLFQFGELPPGKYTVDVAKLGYTPVAREIDVKAGEIAQMDATLTPLAIPDAAYFESFPFSGYYECALGTAAWVSSCSYPYTAAYYGARDYGGVDLAPYNVPSDVQKNLFRYNFTVDPGAVDVVSEAAWSPTSAAATTMQLVLSCPQYDPVLDDCLEDNGDYAITEGRSPLLVEWKTDKLLTKPPTWVMARLYLPFDGAQVALSQKFDVWNSVWYNQEAPKGWSLLNEQPT